MAMTTYTLVVRENESDKGIVAEVRSDGTIDESTRISYEDYGLTASRDDWTPEERNAEFTADVRTIRLQTERANDGFLFRVLGDGETVAEQRVTDDEWDLATV